MQFYGLSTKPIIVALDFEKSRVHQVWLADDATGAGTLTNLRAWWDIVSSEGKKYGYHVKPSKSWLILKDEHKFEEAQSTFENTNIQVTTSGKRHLGASLGTEQFKDEYMSEKVSNWCKNIEKLTEIAKCQPQAAFSAYIHAEQHKYTYFMRTLTGITETMAPLDDVVTNQFIPTLFGANISPAERDLLALPIKYGGLEMRILRNETNISYSTSKSFTKPLQERIMNQNMDLPNTEKTVNAKDKAISIKKQHEKIFRENTVENQSADMKRNLEQLSEPGASSWLSARPLKDQNFNLNRGEFQDAINLRYDKPLKNLPSKCPCNHQYTVTHAMNCHRGGFINKRHDKIRDYEATLLKKVCNDVQIEPPLQPCNGFTFRQSVNTKPDARSDVRARSFYRDGQNAFFDIQVTNADSNSQRNRTIKAIMKTKEVNKKNEYNTRIMEVEHGTFTPLIFSVKGAIGQECRSFHKILANKISEKTGERYEEVTRMIRIKLSFLITKSALACIRGSRSMYTKVTEDCDDFGFALSELGMGGMGARVE